MFDKEKYLTAGVDESIPMETQLAMWDMIEVARQETELDYLQIFKLKRAQVDAGAVQVIEHSQEVPPFHQTAAFPCDDPVTAKLYVIDDGTHATMCFPEER